MVNLMIFKQCPTAHAYREAVPRVKPWEFLKLSIKACAHLKISRTVALSQSHRAANYDLLIRCHCTFEP